VKFLSCVTSRVERAISSRDRYQRLIEDIRLRTPRNERRGKIQFQTASTASRRIIFRKLQPLDGEEQRWIIAWASETRRAHCCDDKAYYSQAFDLIVHHWQYYLNSHDFKFSLTIAKQRDSK